MKADKDTVTRLLKTARGQIDGIIKMVEEDRYCPEISHQVSAAEAVLKKANQEIIRAHLACCVREAFLSGDEQETEEKIEEFIKIIKKL